MTTCWLSQCLVLISVFQYVIVMLDHSTRRYTMYNLACWVEVQYPFTKFDNVQVDLSLISQIMPIDSPRQNDPRGQSKSGKNSSFSMFKISRLKLFAAGDGMVLFTAFSGSNLKPYHHIMKDVKENYDIQNPVDLVVNVPRCRTHNNTSITCSSMICYSLFNTDTGMPRNGMC